MLKSNAIYLLLNLAVPRYGECKSWRKLSTSYKYFDKLTDRQKCLLRKSTMKA